MKGHLAGDAFLNIQNVMGAGDGIVDKNHLPWIALDRNRTQSAKCLFAPGAAIAIDGATGLARDPCAVGESLNIFSGELRRVGTSLEDSIAKAHF